MFVVFGDIQTGGLLIVSILLLLVQCGLIVLITYMTDVRMSWSYKFVHIPVYWSFCLWSLVWFRWGELLTVYFLLLLVQCGLIVLIIWLMFGWFGGSLQVCTYPGLLIFLSVVFDVVQVGGTFKSSASFMLWLFSFTRLFQLMSLMTTVTFVVRRISCHYWWQDD